MVPEPHGWPIVLDPRPAESWPRPLSQNLIQFRGSGELWTHEKQWENLLGSVHPRGFPAPGTSQFWKAGCLFLASLEADWV